MAYGVRFEAVSVGLQIGPVTHLPTNVDLFRFSAATWNSHRIHYDITYAQQIAGYDALLIHGPLQGVYLQQLLTMWAPSSELREFRYRNRSPAPLGVPLHAQGDVAEVMEGKVVRCDVWMRTDDGTITTSGEGILTFP